MSNVKAMNPARALYNDLRAKYSDPSVIITDSYLRFEIGLTGSPSVIAFNALTNQGQATATEKRLNITDLFCCAQISMAIMKTGTATTTPTANELAVGILRTFPNPNVFTGAQEAANLHNLYNGSLSIRVDSTVWIDSFDCNRFYRVPTSQKGTAVSAVALTGVLQDDGYDSLNYGYSPLTPTIMFNGRGKNEVNINMPGTLSLAGTSSYNTVVFLARGFLLQNAAKGN